MCAESGTASPGWSTRKEKPLDIALRPYRDADHPFLEDMLYEAVYWRRGPGTPSREEALALPDLRRDVESMGRRDGDAAVIAELDGAPVGAAWMRLWPEGTELRGFVAPDVPVLAIAVRDGFRGRGVGGRLIDALAAVAAERSVPRISLCVSKDNAALGLYRRKGFVEHADHGHSFDMVRATPGVS